MTDDDRNGSLLHPRAAKSSSESDMVPAWLRVTAAWGWRLIVLGIVLLALASMFTSVSAIVVPVIIALFITAPMGLVVDRLASWHIHRGIGAALAILLLIVVVLGLMTVAGAEIVAGFSDLSDAAIAGFDELLTWLADGPLHVSADQLAQFQDSLVELLQGNWAGIASGALSFTGTVGGLAAGSIIALITLFFFLRDGGSMWNWAIGVMPDSTSAQIDRAGHNAWHTLRRYTQTTVFVAFVDAVGIGLGAWILGVPLAFPIAILVFLFSFIPMLGATLSGIIAVLVALVDGGLTTALWMTGVVLLVQQLEGNVLYPLLFGKVSSLHPLVILLTVSFGTLLLGLVGAIIAVPIVAFIAAFARGLHKEFRPAPEPPPLSDQIPELAHKSVEAIQRVVHTGQIRVRNRGGADASQGEDSEEAPPTEDQIPIHHPGAADDEDGRA
ncbi:AI-2E family transporter [Demequina sp. NBRC 110054]|uniref:AI-2E family transporter n=1 Tax=Demequina sp. NBRC 110054 TaxID=1570343 RepID=UPI000A011447|nr:AI-2E family transporter [Demequina sp. NBRC 110054]